ncbi:MAG: glycosyltransferase family 4 protein [Desulfobacteraceae bacterium]|nr:glycosyltransferase family 4 protein [Desulfobacteraceae bacterium]
MIFALVLTLAISWLFTGLIRRYALSRQLLDIPNQRSSHTRPTPRGGGLAMVAGLACGLLLAARPSGLGLAALALPGLGGLLVAAAGWLDDQGHVSPAWRLLAHVMAVALGIYGLDGAPALAVAGFVVSAGPGLDLALGLLLVWLLNLFNFMDGIDGLAVSEAAFVALGAAVIVLARGGGIILSWPFLLLASACLGFLPWNWPPPAIFMGDAGSGFLGYVLGLAALWSVKNGGPPAPVWFILLALFWVDATWTLAMRLLAGERWWTAHCLHAYQRAARRYQSHKTVTLAALAINLCWLLPLALFATARPWLGWPLTALAATPLLALVIWIRSREP